MARIDYYKVAPGGVKAVYALEQYVRASELEPALIELVKLRASRARTNPTLSTTRQSLACYGLEQQVISH